ncbi:MAG: hypothetical protein CMJ83_04185 [Planctomycetes bacterium]|nr:hypothetical protein [Planctomycetota bacterium]
MPTPALSPFVLSLILAATVTAQSKLDPHLVFAGKEGPGKGKHIVLIAGDEEYRSEEAMPMLGRLLADRHGFKCTVLFSLNPETGDIDPSNQTFIPGLEALKTADMAVVFLRFREFPDADMKHFDDFVKTGKPIYGIRTSTHAFQYRRKKDSPYRKYHFRAKEWARGFGGMILGDTWVNHHGHHGSQSTRGVPDEAHKDHPVLHGVKDVWGPTDVYGVRNLPKDAKVLLRGQVLEGMKPDSAPLAGKKNDPMMPLVWVREFENPYGKKARSICSTIGASQDFASAGLRRVAVNACYWGLGLDVPQAANVEIVGTYEPLRFGFGRFRKGVRPSHFVPK